MKRNLQRYRAWVLLVLILLLSACAPSAETGQTTTGETSVTETAAPTATPAPTATSPAVTGMTSETSSTAGSETSAATTEPSVTSTSAQVPTATPTPDLSAAIHKNALIIDTHNDTVLKIIDKDTWLPKINIAGKTSFMVDLPKLQAGGVDIATFASYTPGFALSGGGQDFNQANSRLLALINAVRWTIAQNSKTTFAVLSASDLDTAAESSKTGILASIEGAYSFSAENAVELLRQYNDLGIRMLAPVWSNSNALGEGVNEKYKDGTLSSGGLTLTGQAVIAEMNRLGMLVDVSHMNEETFWDTLEMSDIPVIASHSSVYSLCRNVRNLKDSQIDAIAADGGVIQVNFYTHFLSSDPDSVDVDTLVDHIDYIVRRVGIDHVGLGSDFDGAEMPDGLKDASMLPNVTRELVSRGYSETDVGKILGGNTARLMRQVWNMAPARENSGPVIETAIAMGQAVSTPTPELTAQVSCPSGLDLSSLQIIVDGVAYAAEYDEAAGAMRLLMPTALKEKFHVMTFAAASTGGAVTRVTRIFYLNAA